MAAPNGFSAVTYSKATNLVVQNIRPLILPLF